MTALARSVSSLSVAFMFALLVCGILNPQPAAASEALLAAAATANQGLAACGSNSGKALHECVANVLDRLNNEISSANVPNTQRSLQAASAGLRAAAGKAQALQAIAQCRSAIASALSQVKAMGGGYVPGWGDTGLSAIAGVLARATQLIQSKG